MASRALKLDPRKAVTSSSPQPKTSPHKTVEETEVAVRAYQLWVERGCPIGSPELDWYQAEEELKGRGQPAETAA